METSSIEVRNPKTPNARKTRLATSTLIGAIINQLYIVEVARFHGHILLQFPQPKQGPQSLF
jgi:hypothetical protein